MADAKTPPKTEPKAKAAPKRKAAARTAPKKSAARKSVAPITVRTAGRARFCRAGMCFGKEPTTVTDYTQEQLAAWEAETHLVVEK